MKTISVPFFIRFDDLVKKIKETFGQDYEIVNIFQDENRKWQLLIKKPNMYERTFAMEDIYREKTPQLEELKIPEIITDTQKQRNYKGR